MNYKKYIPFLILIPLVALIVIFGQRSLSPEPLRTQISGANSLEQIYRLQLAIDIGNEAQFEIDYDNPEEDDLYALVRRQSTEGNVDRIEGQQALEQIETFVEQIPSLADSDPLNLVQSILEQEDLAAPDIQTVNLRYQLDSGLQKTIYIQFEEQQPEANPSETEQETAQIGHPPQQPPPQQPPTEQEQPVEEDTETKEEPIENNDNVDNDDDNNNNNDDDNHDDQNNN